jgi:hypothetical protein
VRLPKLHRGQVHRLCERSGYLRALALQESGYRAFCAFDQHLWPAIVPRVVFLQLLLHILGLPVNLGKFPLCDYFAAAVYLASPWLEAEVFRLYVKGQINVCHRREQEWPERLRPIHFGYIRRIISSDIKINNAASMLVRLLNIFGIESTFTNSICSFITDKIGFQKREIIQIISLPGGTFAANGLTAKIRRRFRQRTLLFRLFLKDKLCNRCERKFDDRESLHPPALSIYFVPCCNSPLHIGCLVSSNAQTRFTDYR